MKNYESDFFYIERIIDYTVPGPFQGMAIPVAI
jgi:hypothetical protein